MTAAAASAALLLAEHEAGTRDFLQRHLTDDGFEVVGAAAAREALDVAEAARPDLMLVGNPLPDASAAEFCRRIREGEPGRRWDTRVPVIVLDGAGDAVDRVRVLDRGADDYLAKPFAYDELVARIRAILRRTAPASSERLTAGEISVDRVTRAVRVAGDRVLLAAKEYELLCRLMSDPTRVFPKEQLLREVWGYRSLGRTRTLDSHASRLRRKLARDGAGPFVVNVWGVGYRLMDD